MSMTKLTLSAPAEVISSAERLAKERHTSISAMFVNYIRSLETSSTFPETFGPITQSLTGIIHLPDGFDEKEFITQCLAEKYGIK